MKIVQLSVNLGQGGAQRFYVDLCNELANEHEVILITSYHKDEPLQSFYQDELSDKVKHINLGYKGRKFMLPIFFIKSLYILMKIQPGVVHMHLDVLLYALLPMLVLRKTKFIHTVHGDANRHLIHRKLKWIYRYIYKNKVTPVTITENSDESFRKLYGLDNSILIPNGRKTVEKTSEFRIVHAQIESMKWNSESLVFIHLGRCRTVKNQELLVDSFNELLNNGYNVILLILGEEYDSNLGMELQKKSRKGIYFLGPKKNIEDYMLCSDAFCLSSLSEGLPISLLEAMSIGVIPICTPAGGIPNVIENNKTGYLSENFTKDSYYSALVSYCENSMILSKSTIIDLFESNYSINKCVEKYQELYFNK